MIVVGEILNRVVKRRGERSFFRIHVTTLTECSGVSSILLPAKSSCENVNTC